MAEMRSKSNNEKVMQNKKSSGSTVYS